MSRVQRYRATALKTLTLKTFRRTDKKSSVVSATDTRKRKKEIEEALSSKIIDEVYDVLEKYGITGGVRGISSGVSWQPSMHVR